MHGEARMQSKRCIHMHSVYSCSLPVVIWSRQGPTCRAQRSPPLPPSFALQKLHLLLYSSYIYGTAKPSACIAHAAGK